MDVPTFAHSQITSRQRTARALLLPMLAVGAVLFFIMVPPLGHLLGGVWGVAIVMFAVGSPLGALWCASEWDVGWRRACWRGAGLALAAVLAYGWAFA